MNFFGNILASAFKWYSRQKGVDPYFNSKLIVVVIQALLFLLIFLILNEWVEIPIYKFFSENKFVLILFAIVLLIVNFKYYDTRRINLCVEKFNTKSLAARRIWALITVILFVFPILAFYIIMKIRHPYTGTQ